VNAATRETREAAKRKLDVIANTPSRTAQGAAMYRAAHQLVDVPPVFEDPLALRIIGAEAETALRSGKGRWLTSEAVGMRAWVAVRSRYAEDCFASALGVGVRQYVALGAGLDTFAYRQRCEGVRVFEVDHPATQGWKRERLAETHIAVPDSVVFVPIDFERETILQGLERAPFDFSQLVFFSWLGVTPYLTRDAIMGTLDMVATSMRAGSQIVFDFAAPPGNDARARAGRKAFAARVSEAGEPLRSTFVPEALANELRALGFSSIETTDSAALDSRYFTGRKDGLRLRGGQMAQGRV
jgi:methyltransferase (TIGR00027 family)